MGLKAVFLDRDGVINHAVIRNGKPYPPASVDELEIIPGAIQAMQKLFEAGYLLIGVTNQPDVARGTQVRQAVELINSAIMDKMPIKEFFTCYHDDQDGCTCRKPKPGLILQAAEKYNIDLSQSWMVGDRWKDIAAGKSAGVRTIFINYNYQEIYQGVPANYVMSDMVELSGIILNPRLSLLISG